MSKTSGLLISALIVISFTLVTLVWSRAAPSQPGVLGIEKVHGLVIEDENGKPRGVITTAAGGSVAFNMLDSHGKTNIVLAVDGNDSPFLMLQSADQKAQIGLNITDKGEAMIVLKNANGKRRIIKP